MRIFIPLMLFLLLSLSATANPILDNSMWQFYKIQKNEWIYQIVRESALVQTGIVSTAEVTQYILKKNPQITKPNQVQPGDEILLPIFIIPKANLAKNNGVVNYNFYINSKIYNGIVDPKPPEVRAPTSIAQVSTNQASHVEKYKMISFEVNPSFYFNSIQSALISNGRQATRVSNLNYKLDTSLRQKFWRNTSLLYRAEAKNEDYESNSLALFKLGLKIERNWNDKITLNGELAYAQSSALTNSTSIQVEPVGHPQISISSDFKLFNWGLTSFSANVDAEYLLAGTSDNITLEHGYSYKAGLKLNRIVFKQNLSVNTWWQNTEMITDVTEQTKTELGFGFQWVRMF